MGERPPVTGGFTLYTANEDVLGIRSKKETRSWNSIVWKDRQIADGRLIWSVIFKESFNLSEESFLLQ